MCCCRRGCRKTTYADYEDGGNGIFRGGNVVDDDDGSDDDAW